MANKYVTWMLYILLTPGCTYGFLYTHTTNPLRLNYQLTDSQPSSESAKSSTKSIDVQLQASWDSNSIGKLAKEHGFTEIHYADIEIISVFFGGWRQEIVHIYGK